MGNAHPINSVNADNHIRDTWLQQLSDLITTITPWVNNAGWTTRQINKKLREAEASYDAPALLLQRDTVRVLLEPVARVAPGAEGVVDLYLLPAYDDIASLYFVDGHWQMHYMFAEDLTAGSIRQAKPKPLSEETLSAVLETMLSHAV